MKLDAILVRHLSPTDYRVLTAIEMGMKNHEWVPVPLIESIAKLRRTGLHHILQSLLQHKLIAHTTQQYDGYKLTYQGYDYLALRTFTKRGLIQSVGRRIGVGKEADVHLCQSNNGRLLCLKFHRLGRVSFRTIKNNRDYLQHRQHASWMYLSRLAALREYSCLKALWENKFCVPEPIDVNRHTVMMEFVEGTLLSQVRELRNPMAVFNQLMQMITDMASCGIIHGDFNEFNLLINEKEQVTMIDFPQIVSTNHLNAQMYFDRDVECIRLLFHRRFSIDITNIPRFEEIQEQWQNTNLTASCHPSASPHEDSEAFHLFEDSRGDVLVETFNALRYTEKPSLHSEATTNEFFQSLCEEEEEATEEEEEATEEEEETESRDEETSQEESDVEEGRHRRTVSSESNALTHHTDNKNFVSLLPVHSCVYKDSNFNNKILCVCEEEVKPINVWKSTARRHRRETVRKHVKCQQKKLQQRGNAGKKKDKKLRNSKAMVKLDFL